MTVHIDVRISMACLEVVACRSLPTARIASYPHNCTRTRHISRCGRFSRSDGCNNRMIHHFRLRSTSLCSIIRNFHNYRVSNYINFIYSWVAMVLVGRNISIHLSPHSQSVSFELIELAPCAAEVFRKRTRVSNVCTIRNPKR